MPLENVTVEVIRPSPREEIPVQQPVMELVNNTLDIEAVSSHITQHQMHDTMDPKVRHELVVAQEEPSASYALVKSPIEHNNILVQIQYEHG